MIKEVEADINAQHAHMKRVMNWAYKWLKISVLPMSLTI